MNLPFLNKSFVRVNKSSVAVVLFLIIMFAIHQVKPSLLYTKEGSFRQFGVGYRQKTVVPIWLAAIFISILCYLLVMSYLMFF
jgi:hypothetical protein